MQLAETPLNARQPNTFAHAEVRCPACSTRSASVIVMNNGAIACGFCGHTFDANKRDAWLIG